MAAQITVVLGGTAGTTITGGKVSDPNGNLWDLPATVTLLSSGSATVSATADSQNPQATFPGSAVNLTIEAGAITGWDTAATFDQLTPPEFRSCFPEFSSEIAYPDGLIQYWLTWSYLLVNTDRFGKLADNAVQLYAAHNIALERRAYLESQKPSPSGAGAPGMATGAASARSVDKVSVTYDTGAVAEKDGGDYNQTIYGRRFYRLVQLAGMGPVYVGAGWTPPWVFSNGMAWPGPPNWPGGPGWGN